MLQVSLVDAQGRIVRQVYGDRVAADALGEPMKQMLIGAPLPHGTQLGDLIDQVRLLCTVYDPKTGTYRVDYTLSIEIAGGLTFLAAMIWMRSTSGARAGCCACPCVHWSRSLYAVRRSASDGVESRRVRGRQRLGGALNPP